MSSRVSGLALSFTGAAGTMSGPAMAIFRGPNEPRCSHMVEDPGPPLYRKLTGRGGAPGAGFTV